MIDRNHPLGKQFMEVGKQVARTFGLQMDNDGRYLTTIGPQSEIDLASQVITWSRSIDITKST